MIRLIPNVRKAWRMLSVQVAALIVAWSSLPSVQQHAVLEFLRLTQDQITAALGLLVLAGRLIDQPSVRNK